MRFDHCRCLEKRLLKLLGVNTPFLDEILQPPPFSTFSNFSTPLPLKRRDETMKENRKRIDAKKKKIAEAVDYCWKTTVKVTKQYQH